MEAATFNGLYGVASRNIELVITTGVRTSNLTYQISVHLIVYPTLSPSPQRVGQKEDCESWNTKNVGDGNCSPPGDTEDSHEKTSARLSRLRTWDLPNVAIRPRRPCTSLRSADGWCWKGAREHTHTHRRGERCESVRAGVQMRDGSGVTCDTVECGSPVKPLSQLALQ
jgi:hypothetical protein